MHNLSAQQLSSGIINITEIRTRHVQYPYARLIAQETARAVSNSELDYFLVLYQFPKVALDITPPTPPRVRGG